MIEVSGLSKFYGSIAAVDNISFMVEEAETFVLLGTSGCGKTTTLRMINRLVEPTAGTILLNRIDIRNQDPELLRRGIGYVLQDKGLFPHYTVAENVAVVPKLLNWEKKKIRARSYELLDKLSLDPDKFLNSYPHQLSGGQQQRVGLARALMADPPVLLMDEPFGALDPVTRASIRKEFRELDELKKKTIILVTHDIQEAFELGNKICMMNRGKIIQSGSPYQLLFEPQTDFVKEFVRDQRLQLELKSLKLQDIWPLIPSINNGISEHSLDEKTTLWDALSSLINTDQNRTLIRNINSDESKIAGYKEIMSAYSEFKNGRA